VAATTLDAAIDPVVDTVPLPEPVTELLLELVAVMLLDELPEPDVEGLKDGEGDVVGCPQYLSTLLLVTSEVNRANVVLSSKTKPAGELNDDAVVFAFCDVALLFCPTNSFATGWFVRFVP